MGQRRMDGPQVLVEGDQGRATERGTDRIDFEPVGLNIVAGRFDQVDDAVHIAVDIDPGAVPGGMGSFGGRWSEIIDPQPQRGPHGAGEQSPRLEFLWSVKHPGFDSGGAAVYCEQSHYNGFLKVSFKFCYRMLPVVGGLLHLKLIAKIYSMTRKSESKTHLVNQIHNRQVDPLADLEVLGPGGAGSEVIDENIQ